MLKLIIQTYDSYLKDLKDRTEYVEVAEEKNSWIEFLLNTELKEYK